MTDPLEEIRESLESLGRKMDGLTLSARAQVELAKVQDERLTWLEDLTQKAIDQGKSLSGLVQNLSDKVDQLIENDDANN